MIAHLVVRARRIRGLHLAVVLLRFLIGFAFVPSALKKLLDQPFTDPDKHGRFHDFLHAFHATGWFYQLVGALQLTAAVLLFTQRFATLGALIAVPILTAITALCWSTGVVPTATVATLMWLGTLALALWDVAKWQGIFAPDASGAPGGAPQTLSAEPSPIDLRLWSWCGAAMLAVYATGALMHGGVYRPRGVELDQPGFYVMPLMLLLPLATYVVERRRRRAG
ncbi:MAG: hypothetical protein KIT31_08700 [Deltaproteobacteria bacterium]|nr:hypothetical protein [Deltaproteobacteria bacterium]